jgi:hypothetical protein
VPDRVLTFWVSRPWRNAPADGPAIVERLLASIQRAPGVVTAAVNRCTPFTTSCSRSVLFFADRPADPARAPGVGRHYISADYFRTLGIPLRSGRAITEQDRAGRPPVTVINETAARRFSGENRSAAGGSDRRQAARSQAARPVGSSASSATRSVDGRSRQFHVVLRFSFPDAMVVVKAIATCRRSCPLRGGVVGGRRAADLRRADGACGRRSSGGSTRGARGDSPSRRCCSPRSA